MFVLEEAFDLCFVLSINILLFEAVNSSFALQAVCLHYTGVVFLRQYSLKYSAFYTLLIIAAVSLHCTIFQLSILLTIGPILDLLGTRLPPHSLSFLTCSVWSCFDRDQNKHVSIMIHAMHRLMWTFFVAKHVLFVVRLIVFQLSVNKAYQQTNMILQSCMY